MASLSLDSFGHLHLIPHQEILDVLLLALERKGALHDHIVSLLVELVHVDVAGEVLLDFNPILTGAMPRSSVANPAARVLP